MKIIITLTDEEYNDVRAEVTNTTPEDWITANIRGLVKQCQAMKKEKALAVYGVSYTSSLTDINYDKIINALK